MILLTALAAIIAAVLLYQGLRDDIGRLDERIKKLEEAKRMRVNIMTLEEMEHAMSGLATLKTDLEIRSNIVDNVIAHLSKAHTPTKK